MGIHQNTTFFSLNGDVAVEELLAQLRLLQTQGYDNFVLHARAGLKIEYLSREWFDLYRAVLADGKERGYTVTVYDEYGWPSGFAGGAIAPLGEEYHAKYLRFSKTPLEKEHHRLLACYERTETGYRRTETPTEEGLYAYCVYDSKYVDILHKPAVDAFVSIVYERYYQEVGEYFGNVIDKFFTDEPAVMIAYPVCRYAWSVRLEEEFCARFGESLIENLWRLEIPTEHAFRQRYYRCTGELFLENFLRPLSAWCNEHGVEWTGHLSAEDGVRGSYRAHGSTMLAYRAFALPGIDFLGKRIPSPVLMKQLTSVANQFSKPRILCESFGGIGYDATWADILRTWNYLAAYGINVPCTHLSAYSIEGSRKRDFPRCYSYQTNGIEHFQDLLSRFRADGEFVSRGRAQNPVLVLSPTVACMGYEREDAEVDDIALSFRTLLENLNAAQVPYDLTDERVLEEYARVEGGEIIIGEGRYSLLVLPYMPSVEPSTVDFLEKYKEQGGALVGVDRYPLLCAFEREPRLEALWAAAIEKEEYPLRNRMQLWETFFSRRYPALRSVRFIDVDGRACPHVLLNVKKERANTYVTLLNTLSTPLEGMLVASEAGAVYRCGDGEKEISAAAGEEGIFARITLPAGGLTHWRIDAKKAPACLETPIVNTLRLRPVSAVCNDVNTLLLDRARVSFDGVNFGEELPVLRLNEYARENVKGEGEVVVRYRFESRVEGCEVELFAENADCRMVVNGVEAPVRGDYFMDKAIRSRGNFVARLGENVIDLYCPVASAKKTEEEFGAETDVNKQELGVEIEAIYLRGNFSVGCQKQVEEARFVCCYKEFYLQAPARLRAGKELTARGLPFYRGSIRHVFAYETQKRGEEYLRLGDFRAFFAVVFVNGRKVGCLSTQADRLALTPYLVVGENQIEIDLYSTERNVFGPFHHAWGGTAITSPLTFAGRYCIGEYVDAKEICTPFAKESFWREGYQLDKLYLQEIVLEVVEKE